MIIAGVQCPNCGGVEVVRITPLFPGPLGWGRVRCKACYQIFHDSAWEDEETDEPDSTQPSLCAKE